MSELLLIGAGGFFGAISRYLVSGLSQYLARDAALPYGTLTVNVLGCLIIGFLGHLSETFGLLSSDIRLLIFIGFLGSFTTFSTFGYETWNLLKDGQNLAAFVNIGANVVICLGAVCAGQAFAMLIKR